MSFESDMAGDLAGIVSEHPTAFVYMARTYSGFMSYTQAESSEMLPAGYDTSFDAKLLVTIAELDGAKPAQNQAIFIDGTEYRIARLDRSAAFLSLDLALVT